MIKANWNLLMFLTNFNLNMDYLLWTKMEMLIKSKNYCWQLQRMSWLFGNLNGETLIIKNFELKLRNVDKSYTISEKNNVENPSVETINKIKEYINI